MSKKTLFLCFTLTSLAAILERCAAISDLHLPAPVFDGGENLSFGNCGTWDTSASEKNPWRAYIWFKEHECAGVLVSKRAIVAYGAGCSRAAQSFQKEKKRLSVVYLGGCIETKILKNDVNCTMTNNGFLATAIQVHKQRVAHGSDIFVWIIESIPVVESKFFRPICLFNRGNELLEQPDSTYQSWEIIASNFTVGKIEPVEDCIDKDKKNKLNRPSRWMLCFSEKSEDGKTRFLINKHKGRYLLRGVSLQKGRYIDFLAFTQWIAQHTPEIYVLHNTTPANPKKVFNEGAENLSFRSCGEKMRLTNRRRRELEDSSDERPIGLIAGGHKASRANHPWHADIKLRNSKKGFCGGTLISKKAVLTAAQCLFNPDKVKIADLEVSLGLYDARMRNESGVQIKTPKSAIIHQNYSWSDSTGEVEHDLALLIFQEGFTLTPKVHPICLWNEDFELDRVVEKPAVFVGFGLNANFTKPSVLQEAILPIISHKECFLQDQVLFSNVKPGFQFCAGHSNGTSTCNEDAGGGLVVQKNGRWFIRGVATIGQLQMLDWQAVCDPKYFSVFTDLAAYMDWIVQNTPDL